MNDVALVDLVRSSSGRHVPGGALSGAHRVDLLSGVLRTLLERDDLDSAAAERIAARCQLDPEEIDACSVQSHSRAAAVTGLFPYQIVPVAVPGVDDPRCTAPPAGSRTRRPHTGKLLADDRRGLRGADRERAARQPAGAPAAGPLPRRLRRGGKTLLMLAGPIPATQKVLRRADLNRCHGRRAPVTS